ncbi:zwei Ig domain protein zig-4-like [Limulus polyphemus]|uniref:Zwei Ig domain protein zig-4-like n=1 Tax=Limulus polyphemus TaxID=6850 RepID=A0ABM1BCT9_LIMPO|nr:zwei Ig domain protein zig-4-like [Limulus polyphemus]XP_022247182.1 zwei Ig domain protein zig-4-like [Limulus polyphemus]XP_022247183.1 zwei Ig domain protein zig-4-like [Limulus polyphemus]XP_022247184.1 zwei Ig domain protein zig-4-like [Limulus polyphemus]
MDQQTISLMTIFSLLSLALSRHLQPLRVHRDTMAEPVSQEDLKIDDNPLLRHHLRLATTPAPVVSVLPFDHNVLSCQAVGNPPPTIHWLKDGDRIIQGTLDSIQSDAMDDGNFNIPPLVGTSQTWSRLFLDCLTPRDGGTYTCVAETPYSRVSSDTRLDISERGLIQLEPVCLKQGVFGFPARIYMWTRFRFEQQGSDVQLFCRSSGLPEPEVTWSRGDDSKPLENDKKHIVLDNGDLLIRSIRWEDIGIYTCTVQNALGSDTTLTFLYPVKP